MAPLTAPLHRVYSLCGCNSIKKWAQRPTYLETQHTPFKGTCLFTGWKYAKFALYRLHLRCYKPQLLSYGIMCFDTKLMSKVIMSRSQRLLNWGYSHYTCLFNGQVIFLTQWIICDWVWLAWLQLSYWAVVFNILASSGDFTFSPSCQ